MFQLLQQMFVLTERIKSKFFKSSHRNNIWLIPIT